MSAVNLFTAMSLMKTRLDRLAVDENTQKSYEARLEAAEADLAGAGIHLTDSMDDMMLLVDTAVWQEKNRDKPGGMPDWLRLRRRERWLREHRGAGT